MRDDVEAFSREREIPYLLHFTRAENIPSIMEHGLVPRDLLDLGIYCGTTNDEHRLDNRRSFNCLSISFPNAPMFFKFRQSNPGVEWPILVIHPGIISRRRTLFCHHNAASNQISQVIDEDLESIDSFKALFEESPNYPTRAEQGLKICDPTNVQAEVLVHGVIPPQAIYFVIFPSIPCQTQYQAILGNRESLVSSRRGYYGTRDYYRLSGDGR